MSQHQHHAHHAAAPALGVVRDPVCGMTVDHASSKHQVTHQRRVSHFCSNGCREKFVADPARYMAPALEPPPAPGGTIYTCPMHPQIRQDHPGAPRSAAWHWNHWPQLPRPGKTMNCRT